MHTGMCRRQMPSAHSSSAPVARLSTDRRHLVPYVPKVEASEIGLIADEMSGHGSSIRRLAWATSLLLGGTNVHI